MNIRDSIQNWEHCPLIFERLPEHWPEKIGFDCNPPELTRQTCWGCPNKCQPE